MDPLSISSAIAGIVVPALHGARLLLEDLDKIVHAPEAIESLREEVASISTSLELLKEIEESVWKSLGMKIRDQASVLIKACEETCEIIRGDLQRWTKRSKGGKLSWLDRVNVGFFRDHQLKAHSGRLQTYQLDFNTIVGTATLYSSIHNAKLTEDMRNAMISQQSSIKAASKSTEAEVATARRTLADLQSDSTANLTTDEIDDLDTTVLNLEELMAALGQSQALLQELSSKTQAPEIAKIVGERGTTTITFGRNEGGMQMYDNHGTINFNGK